MSLVNKEMQFNKWKKAEDDPSGDVFPPIMCWVCGIFLKCKLDGNHPHEEYRCICRLCLHGW